MKFVVVSHTDLDGWTCSYLLNNFIKYEYPDCEIENFQFTHGMDESEIFNACINADEIYVADVTLGDGIMAMFAPKINHFDHHASIINSKRPWWSNIKNEFSKVTVEGYLDTNGNQAKQTAACELVWISLYDDKPMPKMVRLSGRYDVWDHDEHGKTYNLGNYVYNQINEKIFEFENPWFIDLFDDEKLEIALQQGIAIGKFTYNADANSAKEMSVIKKIFGHKVFIANSNKSSSTYFNYLRFLHPDVEGCIIFKYYFDKQLWRFSCYSFSDNFIALDFLKEFTKYVTPITIGGHLKACGMALSTDDILKFLHVINEGETYVRS